MANFSEIVNGPKPVLVDFFAEWCGPCKMMAPYLKQVKETMGEKAVILKIDIDKNPQVAEAFGIQGVPTLILFKQGKTLWRQSGVMPAKAMIELLEKHV